jgi:hypothetical protein
MLICSLPHKIQKEYQQSLENSPNPTNVSLKRTEYNSTKSNSDSFLALVHWASRTWDDYKLSPYCPDNFEKLEAELYPLLLSTQLRPYLHCWPSWLALLVLPSTRPLVREIIKREFGDDRRPPTCNGVTEITLITASPNRIRCDIWKITIVMMEPPCQNCSIWLFLRDDSCLSLLLFFDFF